MLELCSLSSSSKGNCWLIRYNGRILIIDIGISFRKLSAFFEQEQLDLSSIVGICISHEHSDHSSGLATTLKNRSLSIYCNFLTAESLCENYNINFPCTIFNNDNSFTIDDFHLTPFSVPHDAIDPVGFKITCGQYQIAICTDLGYLQGDIYEKIKGVNTLVIESNHDENLLERSQRPALYKRRVLSRNGHISNRECASLLQKIQHPDLHEVILAHLSQECNNIDLAIKTVSQAINPGQCQARVRAAPLSEPSPWITLA